MTEKQIDMNDKKSAVMLFVLLTMLLSFASLFLSVGVVAS